MIGVLIIGQESEISHSSDPSVFLNGLDSASTENRDNSASIDILARAVNLASDPTPRPGMAKTVLFITSAIDGDIEQAISDISNQAQQQDISISVWFVASRGAVISKSAQLLTALVNGSQGEIFSFSGEEAIPNPGEFLESIRYIYRISYSSKAGIDEVQQFRADVQFEDEIVQSNQLSFQVDLLPPEPALIAPPISIERTLAEHIESGGDNPAPNDTINIVDLVPGEIPLQVVFDFPDGRKRDLIRSALLVDGVLVAENLSAPFDLFVWDLRNYLSDQTVKIQVECTDVLGITGASLEIPVDIYVVRPERDPWYVIRKNSTTIILIILLLVGGLLFLALILAGKLRPFTQVAARRVPTKSFNHNLPEQPVETPTGKNHGWSNRIQQHSANSNPEAGAYLRRIETNSGDGIESVIAILQHEILFGSDPDQVDILIEEPCIDPIHARLEVLSEDKYWLYDMGSIGGTWVNYTPITDKGTMLATEDLIHFGRIGFKFVIRDTSSAIKPVIILETAQKSDTPKDPQEDSKENIS